MISVWADRQRAGRLDRLEPRGAVFAYEFTAQAADAVSMTMPVRLESYGEAHRLLPIFEMNLPEGALRERLRLRFAKATGRFDDLDLLSVVGRSQIGRLRYTAGEANLDDATPFQSVDEILSSRRDGDFYAYLIDTFAESSGISGVQPKIMIRDDTAADTMAGDRAPSVRGATHIVKFWDPAYPQLAANKFFCLTAARRAGLSTPRFQLSQDGAALVVDRFDLRADGSYKGFEDFAVLNARSTADKYRGSIETSLFKRLSQFTSPAIYQDDGLALFTLVALNVAVRNGDAHLKNFGLIYDSPEDCPRLSPVYDVVTTTAYLPRDSMALTLNGSTRWPTRDQLIQFGEARTLGSNRALIAALERVGQALTDTLVDLRRHCAQEPAFRGVGERMAQEWEEGTRTALQPE